MCQSCREERVRENPDKYLLAALNHVIHEHDYYIDHQKVVPIVGSIRSKNLYDKKYCDILFTPNKWYIEDFGCTSHATHKEIEESLERVRKMFYGLVPLGSLELGIEDDFDEDDEEEEDVCYDCGCAECECEDEEEDDDDEF